MHGLHRRLHKAISIAVLFALLATLVAAPAPAFAQEEEDETTEVVILPIDRADFLPGAYFDVRIEVWAEEVSEEFVATINGEELSDFFGVDSELDSWVVGDDETPVQGVTWRGVSLPEAGDYVVEVTIDDEVTSVTWTAHEPATEASARNVILFIADGMTIPLITAARLVSQGNVEGKYLGELAMDSFEEIGLAHTSSVDTIMTDSANAASALNTGHKGSVNALGVYADSSPDSLDDPWVETTAELAKRVAGKAIGVVTTSDFTDATPAAVWSHTRRRADAEYISAAPLDQELYPEVIFGGGARWLLPQTATGSGRKDDRDLFAEYEEAGYAIATTASELQELFEDGAPERVLGIFHPSNLNVWLDRNVYTENLGDFTDQPGLVELTELALEVLGENENGFYLEVEAASVDKQIHPLDWERAIADLIEFDQAIAAAVEWAAENAPDTLIVVTADHGHGFDVYGTVDVETFNAGEDDAARREAVQVYADAGFPTFEDADGDGFPDDWNVSVTLAATVNNHPDYTEDFQVSPTPRVPAIAVDGVYVDNPDDDPNGILLTGNLPVTSGSQGVHTLQDVPIFASGPGADFFGRVLDNNEIFFGIVNALGINPITEVEE